MLGVSGLASIGGPDGKIGWTYKVKGALGTSEFIGDNYFIHSAKAIIGLNLDNGMEKGRYKFVKGAKWGTTDDGEYFFVMGKKGVSRYKVNN